MDVAKKLRDLAFTANANLAAEIDAYKRMRRALESAFEQQGIAIRALAAVDPEAEPIARGHELELRAVQALAHDEEGE